MNGADLLLDFFIMYSIATTQVELLHQLDNESSSSSEFVNTFVCVHFEKEKKGQRVPLTNDEIIEEFCSQRGDEKESLLVPGCQWIKKSRLCPLAARCALSSFLAQFIWSGWAGF
jgi:hypothetical protein